MSDGNRDVDRRRAGPASHSPMATLPQLPALVVLERLPVPVLAVGQDGTILFANGAFAEMLGHNQETLLSLKFHQIFHTLQTGDSASPLCTHTRIYSSS